ncbi:hypothetical protein WJX72_010565 [[Myrmecia] bisecta]|uniref:Uncharacterized protein n=1 Tax=[Myrmecia] bisecta TaxID=41462 RepID=A0AAW1PE01_9CHLO
MPAPKAADVQEITATRQPAAEPKGHKGPRKRSRSDANGTTAHVAAGSTDSPFNLQPQSHKRRRISEFAQQGAGTNGSSQSGHGHSAAGVLVCMSEGWHLQGSHTVCGKATQGRPPTGRQAAKAVPASPACAVGATALGLRPANAALCGCTSRPLQGLALGPSQGPTIVTFTAPDTDCKRPAHASSANSATNLSRASTEATLQSHAGHSGPAQPNARAGDQLFCHSSSACQQPARQALAPLRSQEHLHHGGGQQPSKRGAQSGPQGEPLTCKQRVAHQMPSKGKGKAPASQQSPSFSDKRKIIAGQKLEKQRLAQAQMDAELVAVQEHIRARESEAQEQEHDLEQENLATGSNAGVAAGAGSGRHFAGAGATGVTEAGAAAHGRPESLGPAQPPAPASPSGADGSGVPPTAGDQGSTSTSDELMKLAEPELFQRMCELYPGIRIRRGSVSVSGLRTQFTADAADGLGLEVNMLSGVPHGLPCVRFLLKYYTQTPQVSASADGLPRAAPTGEWDTFRVASMRFQQALPGTAWLLYAVSPDPVKVALGNKTTWGGGWRRQNDDRTLPRMWLFRRLKWSSLLDGITQVDVCQRLGGPSAADVAAAAAAPTIGDEIRARAAHMLSNTLAVACDTEDLSANINSIIAALSKRPEYADIQTNQTRRQYVTQAVWPCLHALGIVADMSAAVALTGQRAGNNKFNEIMVVALEVPNERFMENLAALASSAVAGVPHSPGAPQDQELLPAEGLKRVLLFMRQRIPELREEGLVGLESEVHQRAVSEIIAEVARQGIYQLYHEGTRITSELMLHCQGSVCGNSYHVGNDALYGSQLVPNYDIERCVVGRYLKGTIASRASAAEKGKVPLTDRCWGSTLLGYAGLPHANRLSGGSQAARDPLRRPLAAVRTNFNCSRGQCVTCANLDKRQGHLAKVREPHGKVRLARGLKEMVNAVVAECSELSVSEMCSMVVDLVSRTMRRLANGAALYTELMRHVNFDGQRFREDAQQLHADLRCHGSGARLRRTVEAMLEAEFLHGHGTFRARHPGESIAAYRHARARALLLRYVGHWQPRLM